jgi:hypothetical protein
MGKCAIVVALLVDLTNSAFARDDSGYANDPLKYWFDNLTSSNGKCCSFADGFSISDVDWDPEDSHYRVLLHGEWINVPNSSVGLSRIAMVQRLSGPIWTATATSPLSRGQSPILRAAFVVGSHLRAGRRLGPREATG